MALSFGSAVHVVQHAYDASSAQHAATTSHGDDDQHPLSSETKDICFFCVHCSSFVNVTVSSLPAITVAKSDAFASIDLPSFVDNRCIRYASLRAPPAVA